MQKLKDRGVDVFTFIERSWCNSIPNPSSKWVKKDDNVALLKVDTYAKWLESVGKKTRNMIRKAEKSGVSTRVAEPSEQFAEGMWKI